MAGRSLGPTVRAGWRVVSTRPRGAPDPISLEALRVALRAATNTRSLRQVAAEVGISHTGLRGFLAGAKPHPHTRHKLERWVTELSARRIREVGGAYAGDAGAGAYALGQSAVQALAAEIDSRLTDRAAREFHELVLRLHRDAGKEPPAWLEPPE